jgi:hypothetical protein
MKIRFASEARRQFDLLLRLDSGETGFIVGRDIGGFRIIKNFFSVHFHRKNIGEVYETFLHEMNEELLGVFFINRRLFVSDWFCEDIILKIEGQQATFFDCRFDSVGRRKELIEILDWEVDS